MTAKREIDNLSCIFNLSVFKAMHLDKPITTRVQIIYDKNKNRKEIIILHKLITEEMRNRLTSWLEHNVEVDDILHNIMFKEINIDEFKRVSNW
jgi:hypothetical protein